MLQYLIIGLGKTGYSIAKYLYKREKNFSVFCCNDQTKNLIKFKKTFKNLHVFYNTIPKHIYYTFKSIIVSPGISLNNVIVKEAIKLNIPIFGDIEFFTQEINKPIVAITGTNGKSTVTTLVGNMIKLSGNIVAVAGNIGIPVLNLLDNKINYNIWVLELSSFQLDLTYSLKPLVSTILNISHDHLDRYDNYKQYIRSKHRIYEQSTYVVYNGNDKNTYPKIKIKEDKLICFSLNIPKKPNDWGIIQNNNLDYISRGKKPVFPVKELNVYGKKNLENILSACALSYTLGIKYKYIIKALKKFVGLPYRCQFIRNINGVTWINNSKGTNIGSTISAIHEVQHYSNNKMILIAGGLGKNSDFSILQESIIKYVKVVVLIGKDAMKIANALSNIKIPIFYSSSLEEAVQISKKQSIFGDVILFSPSCSSLDMFENFMHRGAVFNSIILKIDH